METAVQSNIRKLVADHARLPVDAAEIGLDDDLYDLGMTSHANVALMLALEDEFDMEFPEEMLSRTTFESITAIERSIHTIVGADLDARPA